MRIEKAVVCQIYKTGMGGLPSSSVATYDWVARMTSLIWGITFSSQHRPHMLEPLRSLVARGSTIAILTQGPVPTAHLWSATLYCLDVSRRLLDEQTGIFMRISAFLVNL